MKALRLDHLVLTVDDVDEAVAWYVRVLGMEAETFGAGRRAVRFGDAKLNLHATGAEHPPTAQAVAPGTADFCLLTDTPLDDVLRHLSEQGVEVIEGPVERTGATGPLRSVYVRDPDGNLVEIANPA
jgi:catechol 2,3-dioxygenase-like lactoylglutathione lyase family enzyme